MFPIRDHNPSQKTPLVTYALIAANVAVYLWMFPLFGDDRALYAVFSVWGIVPRVADPVTYVTSMFIHGGFMHLAGNMLFLWIFGDNMEDEMGHAPFLGFYLLGGITAGVAQTLVDPSSPVPLVGASGAIAGVMGGYLLLFPRARVDVLFIFVIFFRIFPIPAWIVLGIWFAIQLFSGASVPTAQGGVAYWAHVGGFAAGLLMTLPLWLRRGGAGYWGQTSGRPPNPEATYVSVVSAIPRAGRGSSVPRAGRRRR